MIGSEIAYVRAELGKKKHAELGQISKASGVHIRTVKRIFYREIEYPRSDTVGKLALYFRTKAARRRA